MGVAAHEANWPRDVALCEGLLGYAYPDCATSYMRIKHDAVGHLCCDIGVTGISVNGWC